MQSTPPYRSSSTSCDQETMCSLDRVVYRSTGGKGAFFLVGSATHSEVTPGPEPRPFSGAQCSSPPSTFMLQQLHDPRQCLPCALHHYATQEPPQGLGGRVDTRPVSGLMRANIEPTALSRSCLDTLLGRQGASLGADSLSFHPKRRMVGGSFQLGPPSF